MTQLRNLGGLPDKGSRTAGRKAPNYGNFQLETTFERIGTGMHKVDHTKELL